MSSKIQKPVSVGDNNDDDDDWETDPDFVVCPLIEWQFFSADYFNYFGLGVFWSDCFFENQETQKASQLKWNLSVFVLHKDCTLLFLVTFFQLTYKKYCYSVWISQNDVSEEDQRWGSKTNGVSGRSAGAIK